MIQSPARVVSAVGGRDIAVKKNATTLFVRSKMFPKLLWVDGRIAVLATTSTATPDKSFIQRMRVVCRRRAIHIDTHTKDYSPPSSSFILRLLPALISIRDTWYESASVIDSAGKQKTTERLEESSLMIRLIRYVPIRSAFFFRKTRNGRTCDNNCSATNALKEHVVLFYFHVLCVFFFYHDILIFSPLSFC